MSVPVDEGTAQVFTEIDESKRSDSLDSLENILNNLDDEEDTFQDALDEQISGQVENVGCPTKEVTDESLATSNADCISDKNSEHEETDNSSESFEKNESRSIEELNNNEICTNDLLTTKQLNKVKEDEDDATTPKSRKASTLIHENSDVNIINNFLDKCGDDAEARLLARRQARAEAREIRMRELERQQKEQEENADRQFDMLSEPAPRTARVPAGSRYLSSRRSSEDSLEDGGSLREIRHELKDVEEKFRKAMIANAQLDNDKSAQTYQLELLKDRLEELEEEHSQLRREHRDKCREHDQLKRLGNRLKEDLAVTRAELEERDKLIAEKGLVIVGENIPPDEGGDADASVNCVNSPKKALVSVENAQLLETVGEGSLDVRLAKVASEKRELQDQISHLRLELEEERSKRKKSNSIGPTLNGPTSDVDSDSDLQKDALKQLADFKFRAQKAEQDVATLQATVARLESQVIRYKSSAEMSEKSEEALKQEKRKLQREAREAQNRAEELETSNNHLLKRLDKLKNAKSALLKEL